MFTFEHHFEIQLKNLDDQVTLCILGWYSLKYKNDNVSEKPFVVSMFSMLNIFAIVLTEIILIVLCITLNRK